LFESFLNFFNQSKSNIDKNNNDHNLMLISGILVEAAAIDGKIDKSEVSKIKRSLVNFFEITHDKSSEIVDKSLNEIDASNSFYYFTSKINKEYEYDKKIELIEILWEIILADGEIHDFESNLIRRLSGLLYVSDIDCGNAKKKALKNN